MHKGFTVDSSHGIMIGRLSSERGGRRYSCAAINHSVRGYANPPCASVISWLKICLGGLLFNGDSNRYVQRKLVFVGCAD
jgi:hypothetical protein